MESLVESLLSSSTTEIQLNSYAKDNLSHSLEVNIFEFTAFRLPPL